MRKKYQVFVSSTYEDLIEERKRATQEIMKAGCIPAGMELFPAANDDQWRLIQNAIDESDFYVVISAGRYGTETKTPDGEIISYTEMEFDYAIKTGKYIIGLLHSDIESLPAKYSEKSDEKRKRLDGFHRKIKDGREVSFWKTGDELSASLAHALYYAKENSSCPGWLRAENEPDSLPLSNDSIDEYESKIKNLENQVSTLSKKNRRRGKGLSNLSRRLLQTFSDDRRRFIRPP